MTQSGVYVGFDNNGEPQSVSVYGAHTSITKRQAAADCSKGGLRTREFHHDDPELKDVLDRWVENALNNHFETRKETNT